MGAVSFRPPRCSHGDTSRRVILARASSSAVERLPYTEEVGGSSPSSPTSPGSTLPADTRAEERSRSASDRTLRTRAAAGGEVQVHGHAAAALEVTHLGRPGFAEDQRCAAVPVKPHRPGLRRAASVHRGEPEDLLATKTPVHPPSETRPQVEHRPPTPARPWIAPSAVNLFGARPAVPARPDRGLPAAAQRRALPTDREGARPYGMAARPRM